MVSHEKSGLPWNQINVKKFGCNNEMSESTRNLGTIRIAAAIAIVLFLLPFCVYAQDEQSGEGDDSAN